ncbi:MAG: DUF4399 domain-containing protein [Acidimicrobiales bacterium]
MSVGRRTLGLTVATTLLLAACGADDETRVSFVAPADGATLAGGVHVEMAADGITIEEAGEAREGAGHFHLIADAGCTAAGKAIGKDADHVHFGKGQTEGVIYLEPGEHELCLEVGDGVHSALGVTATRTVQIEISDQEQWCAVVEEVDELFVAVDDSSDEFPVKQIGYENIRRLTAQLEAGIGVIDAAPSDRVKDAIEFAAAVATAFVDAADLGAAEKALEPLFEELAYQENLPGAAWIKSECGVDVNG